MHGGTLKCCQECLFEILLENVGEDVCLSRRGRIVKDRFGARGLVPAGLAIPVVVHGCVDT